MTSQKRKLVAVVGPTASGKSGLAVDLALAFNGEIVSADSRQVYRGFNLSAGKITEEEMRGIPHHLLDVADPAAPELLTLSEYLKMSRRVIDEIFSQDKLPIIAGGTGLYVSSLIEGYTVPEVKPDQELRARLNAMDLEQLRTMYKSLDPEGFARIDTHNPRRLVRAIEVVMFTGKPFFDQSQKIDPGFDTLLVGIDIPFEKLKEKIRTRLLERMEQGMQQEITNLHQAGVSWDRMEELGLEFRWLGRLAQGQIEKARALAGLEKDIIAYAKRQLTWWRKKDVVWVKDSEEAQSLVALFLAS